MSTNYRTLRRAVDNLVAAEDAIVEAEVKRIDAKVKLGRALRACREHKKLSLRQTARQLGVSAAYLSDVENGWRNLSAGNLESLMGIIGPPTINDIFEAIQKAKNSPPSNLKLD